MKKIPAVVAVLAFALSCSQSPECWGPDRNEGIIVRSLEIGCFPALAKRHYVITSDSAYRRVFSGSAAECDLPAIDFSLHTLLGVEASGGCEIKVIREVVRVESERRYRYKVKVRECGICKKLAVARNWVTVPRIQEDWTVSFEIKK